MFQKGKDRVSGGWTVDAVASFSTLEVLQEVLNGFFAPDLRRKLDPCRLVGNGFIDSTWPLLMPPESLNNRNCSWEATTQDTWKDVALGKRWGGFFQDQPCNDFWNKPPKLLTKSSLHVEGLLKTSRKALGIESSVLTMFWGVRSHRVISQWTYSPSILLVLLQVDPTKWFFPPKEENFPQFLPQFLSVVVPNLLSPTSYSLISSSGDRFKFLPWPSSNKWDPGIHWDHPLQIFLYTNPVVWGLARRIPPSPSTVSLKYGIIFISGDGPESPNFNLGF